MSEHRSIERTGSALDRLPLYAPEDAIARAVLGPRRCGEWKQIAALLEPRGLPKIDPLMGGRYVPAVKAFFDVENGLAAEGPLEADGVEDLGAWRRRGRRRG